MNRIYNCKKVKGNKNFICLSDGGRQILISTVSICPKLRNLVFFLRLRFSHLNSSTFLDEVLVFPIERWELTGVALCWGAWCMITPSALNKYLFDPHCVQSTVPGGGMQWRTSYSQPLPSQSFRLGAQTHAKVITKVITAQCGKCCNRRRALCWGAPNSDLAESEGMNS